MRTYTNVSCRFILNGLSQANELLGEEVFKAGEWRVVGEYVQDEEGGRHQAFVSPLQTTDVLGSTIHPHERIRIEQSWKFSKSEMARLWTLAGLSEIDCWSRGDEYGKCLQIIFAIILFPRVRLAMPGLYATPRFVANDTSRRLRPASKGCSIMLRRNHAHVQDNYGSFDRAWGLRGDISRDYTSG